MRIIEWFLIGVTGNLIICTCMLSFYSVTPHLELAILSRMFRIGEHEQSSVVENFILYSAEFSSSLQDLNFHQVMGIMLQKQLIY